MTTEPALYPSERLTQVTEAARVKGIDVLLLSPGPDLRYVTGYDAKQLERLTCLAVPAQGDPFLLVPQLELRAAQASPAGDLELDMVTWGETENPFGIIKKAPSGAYRTDLARAAVAQLKAQGVDVYGKKWKKANVKVTAGGK